jgi:hypothetical protein
VRRVRERVALWLAPWLYVPYREEREEAFGMLSTVAYGSREAVWTSPRVLVFRALAVERARGRKDPAGELPFVGLPPRDRPR